MHELGTINYVIETVENLCVENSLTQVGSVTLEIGEVSGIIPQFLEEYWLYAREKTKFLKDAELKIEPIEAITYCENCQKTYPTMKYAKICPYCGSEMNILSKKLRQCEVTLPHSYFCIRCIRPNIFQAAGIMITIL